MKTKRNSDAYGSNAGSIRPIKTTRISQYRFSNQERAKLEARLNECGSVYEDTEIAILRCQDLVGDLSSDLKDLVRSTVTGGTALVIDNAPQDDEPSLDTFPFDGLRSTKQTCRSEMFSVLIGLAAGARPFSNRYEKNNEMFHNIVPIASLADSQSNGSYVGLFEPHVENLGTAYRPDFFTLSGMLSTGAYAETFISAVDDALPLLNDKYIGQLRQPLFQTRVPESFLKPGQERVWGPPQPILASDSSGHRLCVAFDGTMNPLPDGAEAFGALKTALWLVRSAVVIGKGQVVVVNNDNVVHARGPVQALTTSTVPRRWLQRTYFKKMVRALVESGVDVG